MTQNVGTLVIAPIVPNDSEDTYPTHIDTYGKGGWVAVADMDERDAIPIDRRKVGMVVHVADSGNGQPQAYRLNSSNGFDVFDVAAAEASASAAAAADSASDAAGAAADAAQSEANAQTSEFNASQSSIAASNSQAGAAAQANIATVQAGLASSSASAAASARDAALLSRGIFPTTAAGIGQGVAGVASLVGGSGGTDGTFPLAFTGGTQVIVPQGRFVVTGGTVVQVYIDYPGYYSAGTPTLSFAASSGLTGASATAVMGPNTPVGGYFSVPATSPNYSQLYRVDSGPVATAVGDPYPSVTSITPLLDWRAVANFSALQVYKHLDDKVLVARDQQGRARVMRRLGPNNDLQIYGSINGAVTDSALLDSLNLASVSNLPLKSYPQRIRVVLDTSGRSRVRSRADSASDGPYIYGTEGANSAAVSYYPPATPIPLPVGYAPTLRDYNAAIGYGQSLIVGSQGLPVLSTTQPYSNITFTAGPKATKAGSLGNNPGTGGFKPLVEDTASGDGNTGRGETHCSAMANGLVELAAIENAIPTANLSIFASTAGHGGYTAAQLDWGNSSTWSQVLRDHMTEAKANATALGKTISLQFMPIAQGESDSATSYASYQATWRNIQTNASTFAKTTFGQTNDVPFLWYQTPRNEQIQRAQIDMCLTDAGHMFVTPIFFMPPDSDDTHLTNVGYQWMGRYFARAGKQILIDGNEPDFLKPISITRRGRVVRWRWRVPRLPLVLRSDTTAFYETTDKGFRFVDDNGTVSISSIVVDGSDVIITLGADPVGTLKGRIGLDYHAAASPWDTEFTHNLTDSTPDTVRINGTTYPMYHVAPACEMTVITLE